MSKYIGAGSMIYDPLFNGFCFYGVLRDEKFYFAVSKDVHKTELDKKLESFYLDKNV